MKKTARPMELPRRAWGRPDVENAIADVHLALTGEVPVFEESADRAPEWLASVHYVYILVFAEQGRTYVKVGISDDPDRRASEIQKGSPFRISQMHICQAPTREAAYGLEQTILTRFAVLRRTGEWITTDADRVTEIVTFGTQRARVKFGPDYRFREHKRRLKANPVGLRRRA